jgi:hypothetical protein
VVRLFPDAAVELAMECLVGTVLVSRQKHCDPGNRITSRFFFHNVISKSSSLNSSGLE